MGRGLSGEQRTLLRQLASSGEKGASLYVGADTLEDKVVAASQSRSLRRLKQRGLVEKVVFFVKQPRVLGGGTAQRRWWRLTEKGKEAIG